MRQAIIDRLVGLDSTTMDALTTLAVADDELDLASVLALTGLDERDAFALLDAALDAGVLVVAGTRYRFRHELVRQALIDGLPSHRRLQLHRDAARRLVTAGGAPELIADHWLKGERPGEAVDWLLAATRRAVAVGAFADARAQIERLLIEAPAHHDGLCLRAEILDALGDSRAPEAYGDAAIALGDPEAQELRARQALAQLKASNPDGALRTLEGITPKTTVGRLAEALTLSAAAAIGRYADADTAAAKAQEAHRLAVELGDPGAILDATWAHALAAHAKGELPARLREYLRATHDLPELATQRLRRAAVRHRADASRRASQRRDHRVRRQPRRRGAAHRRRSRPCVRAAPCVAKRPSSPVGSTRPTATSPRAPGCTAGSAPSPARPCRCWAGLRSRSTAVNPSTPRPS